MAAIELLAASFIILFQELTLIRWLGSEIRVLAYFPNLILMSAFLGLGIGCLLGDLRRLEPLWPISLFLAIVTTQVMNRIVFTSESESKYLWLLYQDLPKDSLVIHSVIVPIVICFVVSCLTFIPLGQYVARRLELFRAQSRVLWGYSWDIGGSLLGICAFTFIGFTGTPPAFWFAVIFTLGVVIFRGSGHRLAIYLFMVAISVVLIAYAQRDRAYSPYYSLSVVETPGIGLDILANGAVHQVALDFNDATRLSSNYVRSVVDGYRKPYT